MFFNMKTLPLKANAWALSLFFFLLLLSRRGAQLFSPQVWDEDGVSVTPGGNVGNIPSFLNEGWLSLIDPVNGYLILVPKLITGISLSLTFYEYPLLSTAISFAFIIIIGLAVAFSPTHLSGKYFCAIAIFFIPSDPEVFGLPLYTFWWASLLLFLLVLWDENSEHSALRIIFLLLGGLSSPIIFLALPAFYFRLLLFWRKRIEWTIAISGTAIAFVQLYYVLSASAGSPPSLDAIALGVIPTFFGGALAFNFTANKYILWICGFFLLSLFLTALLNNKRNIFFWLLFYLLLGSVALSIARVDPSILHPRFAGPRYFYFPFVLIYWFLIQIVFIKRSIFLGSLSTAVVVLMALNSLPAWSRSHDDLKWKAHVESCQLFEHYRLPIQFDGNKSSAWSLDMNGALCKSLLTADIFYRSRTGRDHPSYPFVINTVHPDSLDCSDNAVSLRRSSITGADYQKSSIRGCRIIGTFKDADADVGIIELKLRRGDHVFYRSGPGGLAQTVRVVGHENEYLSELPVSTEWASLLFSNSTLPAEFTIVIEDRGQSLGEWSAVAIAN
ncbi:hypothetical protein [Accumulibacter sp.]|uniref:hypothetical protein n=1 Tax=Accumulibacter sp. TaxID=2053492 RepID=UPI0028C3967B|nr:hypothetical protein [Accumulibacter sp.]